ncbi:MAG: CAP domain-containing protein [Polyangiaceae bacterium]
MVRSPSPRKSHVAIACVLASSAAVAGCGFLTGAEDLIIGDGDGGGGNGGSGSGAGNTGTGAGNTGSTGTATDTTTDTGTTATGTGTTATDTTATSPCPPCGPFEVCEAATGTCQCTPGYIPVSGVCTPAPPGDPTTHTADEVCQKWKDGHVVTTPDPLEATGAECDAGTLKQGAINDTLVRINMFRWLAGLGPTASDPAMNAGAQLCANLEAWWNFGSGQSPHSPPADSKCYTQQGAQFAGMSNIAWGSKSPAQAIDQFMQDNGNATTMGHRRWIVNPPLDDVGIGYWKTGGQYGDAECLRVFGQGGAGPDPDFVAVPNQGYVPIQLATWTWTFHADIGGVPNAQVTMLRVDDNTPLDVKVQKLNQGYGEDSVSWNPQGWQPEAGKTYRVTVSGLTGGDITYDVKPLACN